MRFCGADSGAAEAVQDPRGNLLRHVGCQSWARKGCSGRFGPKAGCVQCRSSCQTGVRASVADMPSERQCMSARGSMVFLSCARM